MILALCLLLFSSGLILVGTPLLTRLTSTSRRPLAVIAAWHLASWSAVGGVVLAGALLAAPQLATTGQILAGMEDCLPALDHLSTPADSPLLQTTSALLLAGVLFRLIGCAARSGWTTHRLRARHRVVLNLVGRRDPDLDLHVIDNEAALVYCLPGWWLVQPCSTTRFPGCGCSRRLANTPRCYSRCTPTTSRDAGTAGGRLPMR